MVVFVSLLRARLFGTWQVKVALNVEVQYLWKVKYK
jgi:hypothetical protein